MKLANLTRNEPNRTQSNRTGGSRDSNSHEIFQFFDVFRVRFDRIELKKTSSSKISDRPGHIQRIFSRHLTKVRPVHIRFILSRHLNEVQEPNKLSIYILHVKL